VKHIKTKEVWVFYEGTPPLAPTPSGPAWLRTLLGNEFFDKVIGVHWLNLGDAEAGLEHLERLSSLLSLSLNAANVTDAGLAHLEGLNQLQQLDVMNTEVTDAGLEHLKGLRHLDSLNLWGTKVTNDGLERLERLTQLQELDLGYTAVTDAGLEHLKGLSHLEKLDLSNTAVTDTGLEHLKGLTQLRELCLNNTDVTYVGSKSLQQALPGCKIENVKLVGTISLTDPITGTHVFNLLASKGIECRIEGSSMTLSVTVPRWDAEAATRLLREDAKKRGWADCIRVGDDDNQEVPNVPVKEIRNPIAEVLHRPEFAADKPLGRFLRSAELSAKLGVNPFVVSLRVRPREYLVTLDKTELAYEIAIVLQQKADANSKGFGGRYMVSADGKAVELQWTWEPDPAPFTRK
jgi:hypothetical protein